MSTTEPSIHYDKGASLAAIRMVLSIGRTYIWHGSICEGNYSCRGL